MEARHHPLEVFAANVSHPAVCLQARLVRTGANLRYFLSGHIPLSACVCGPASGRHFQETPP